MQVELPDQQHTHALGRWLAGQLCGGQVVSLEGPLGAGKTTLLQGLAEGLGIKTQITSPTFILFRVLPVAAHRAPRVGGSAIKKLVHADAYRVKDPKELVATGFTEYVGQPDTLVVVEWGDRVRALLPKDTLRIRLGRDVSKKGADSGRTATLPATLPKPPRDWYNS